MLKTLCTFIKDNQLFLAPVTAAQEQSSCYNLICKLNRTVKDKHELTLKDTS